MILQRAENHTGDAMGKGGELSSPPQTKELDNSLGKPSNSKLKPNRSLGSNDPPKTDKTPERGFYLRCPVQNTWPLEVESSPYWRCANTGWIANGQESRREDSVPGKKFAVKTQTWGPAGLTLLLSVTSQASVSSSVKWGEK